jgi:very-short-patch-repair endonuclease
MNVSPKLRTHHQPPKESKKQYDFFITTIRNEFATEIIEEYPFAKDQGRKWRIDFYLPEYCLAIEIEGGTLSRSRHTSKTGFLKDIEKYNELTAKGIRLIRFTPQMLVGEMRYVRELLTKIIFKNESA